MENKKFFLRLLLFWAGFFITFIVATLFVQHVLGVTQPDVSLIATIAMGGTVFWVIETK